MKHLEGKEVYLRPTGNYARNNPTKYEKAVLIKVAKVNVTFKINGSFEQKLRLHNHLKNHLGDNNGAYEVYETKKQVEDYLLSVELSKKIFNKYCNPWKYQELDIETLKKVSELLGV